MNRELINFLSYWRKKENFLEWSLFWTSWFEWLSWWCSQQGADRVPLWAAGCRELGKGVWAGRLPGGLHKDHSHPSLAHGDSQREEPGGWLATQSNQARPVKIKFSSLFYPAWREYFSKVNLLTLSCPLAAKYDKLYAVAVHFFLADGDLQQREWIFCSSVISQKV